MKNSFFELDGAGRLGRRSAPARKGSRACLLLAGVLLLAAAAAAEDLTVHFAAALSRLIR